MSDLIVYTSFVISLIGLLLKLPSIWTKVIRKSRPLNKATQIANRWGTAFAFVIAPIILAFGNGYNQVFEQYPLPHSQLIGWLKCIAITLFTIVIYASIVIGAIYLYRSEIGGGGGWGGNTGGEGNGPDTGSPHYKAGKDFAQGYDQNLGGESWKYQKEGASKRRSDLN